MNKSDTLSDYAYQQLKKKVVERYFEPGSKLNINALGEQLGISRMPIQEAITRLKTDGLVDSRHRVGTYITPLDRKMLLEMFEAREMIEYWVTPNIILFLRDADLINVRAILAETKTLLNDATEKTFDYRRFVELDQQFHSNLIQMCGNSRMIDIYRSLSSHIQIARNYSLKALSRSREGQVEHEQILKAFSERDTEQARAAQHVHISRSRDGIMRLLEERQTL